MSKRLRFDEIFASAVSDRPSEQRFKKSNFWSTPEPLFFGVTFHSDICDIPSHFYRGSRLHGGASAWSGSGRSWIGRRALGATNGAEGHLRRRSLKAVTDSAEGHHRRFLSLVSQRRGHVSHTHWRGTEIFVNHKGL
jgi:hypothetical protein